MIETPTTIYLIEDDPAARHATQMLLELSGWRVCAYGSAEAFLGACHSLQAGCVLVDYRLPGMSGLDLFHELRELGIKLPVIMISGHAEPVTVDFTLAAGVAEFLLKPAIPAQLIECVRRQLNS